MTSGYDAASIHDIPGSLDGIVAQLKAGAHVLLWCGGEAAFDLTGIAARVAGLEMRDSFLWLPQDGSRAEVVLVARKPFDGPVTAHVLAHGLGAMNIGATRVDYLDEDDKASATPQGRCTSKVISAIGAEPDAGRNLPRIEFERPALEGRFPPNVAHGGVEAAPWPEDGGRTTARFFHGFATRDELEDHLIRLVLPPQGRLLRA